MRKKLTRSSFSALRETATLLSEQEQRSMIGGDYWDDHGIWQLDSYGNMYWARTSQGDGYYYDDSGYYSEAATKYGIYLSDINIIVSPDMRGANAWIGNNKEVFLVDAFFGLSSEKKLRILIHEYTHVKEDNPWSPVVKTISTTLPEPSSHIRSYIFEKFGDAYFNLNDFLSYKTLADPRYYRNEANAYKKEKELFDASLTYEERNELDYRIWYYTEMANNAEKYY